MVVPARKPGEVPPSVATVVHAFADRPSAKAPSRILGETGDRGVTMATDGSFKRYTSLYGDSQGEQVQVEGGERVDVGTTQSGATDDVLGVSYANSSRWKLGLCSEWPRN